MTAFRKLDRAWDRKERRWDAVLATDPRDANAVATATRRFNRAARAWQLRLNQAGRRA